MSKKSIMGKTALLLIIALMAAILIIRTSLQVPEAEEQQVLPVKVSKAEKGNLEKRLRISGFIESDTMVTVLPRIGGTLTELYLEMGDSVEKDQLIALIDSEPYQLSFNQARAAFLAAESTFKRVSSLYASKSVSLQNYEEAKANFDALKATYELAELNLSYTELKAPVSGSVLEKHISRGSMVAPQIPVVTIGDINNLKINSGVPELHYSFFQRHKEDMDVHVTIPALENREFKASITNIAPFISPQTRNFIVKCRVIDDDGRLRPGMFAYLDFVLERREGIHYLPFKALSGGKSLWYVDSENKAGQISFTPAFTNEDYFEIPSEMSMYQFISEGQSFLKEDQLVRITGER